MHQNDRLFVSQNMWFTHNTDKYDYKIGIKDVLNSMYNPEDKTHFHIINNEIRFDNHREYFSQGNKGLQFLNNRSNYPWMLKDPRLCITIRTWLPFLNFFPSVLFVYRHPLDVSKSFKNFTNGYIARGMRSWYVYNKHAVLNSNDLCRVVTSNKQIMTSPESEFSRIRKELNLCGLSLSGRYLPYILIYIFLGYLFVISGFWILLLFILVCFVFLYYLAVYFIAVFVYFIGYCCNLFMYFIYLI